MLRALSDRLLNRLTILDRYLIEQFMGPFILSVGGFAIIGIVDILFYLIELFVISGVPFFTILRLLVYKLPAIMILFFPMAVLFSVMLLLVRMAKDNELTVLRTSGVTSLRIITPLIIVTFFTAILSYITNEKIVPWANHTSDQLIRYEIKKKPPPNIMENVVFKDSSNRFFHIKDVDSRSGEMNNILIIEETKHFPRIITAKNGIWNNHSWSLNNGFIQEFNQDGLLEFIDEFMELTINVNQAISTFYKRKKSAKEMNSKDLKEKITTLDKGGVSTRNLKVEYHMKTSIPMACFVFGLVGIAFCLSFVRSGKDWWGVIMAIIIAVLSVGFYFFITALCRALAKDNHLPIFLGAWIPNILYASIAIGIIRYQCKFK